MPPSCVLQDDDAWLSLGESEEELYWRSQHDKLAELMIAFHQAALPPSTGNENPHTLRAKSSDLRKWPSATAPPSDEELIPLVKCGPMQLHNKDATRAQTLTGRDILTKCVDLGDQLNMLLSELNLRHKDTQALVAHLLSTVEGQNRLMLTLEKDASYRDASAW